MIIFLRSMVIAVLIGLLGFIILFTFASISGRGEIGVAAACVFCLYGAVIFTKRYPSSVLYGGTLINIPSWIFFIFLADEGQFKAVFWGLVIILASSYAGTCIGLWLLKRKIVFGKMVKILLVGIPLILIILAANILTKPKSIPPDKNSLVGVWKAGPRFELQIMLNGKAMITQNTTVSDSVYVNLMMQQASASNFSANVEFLSDSIFYITRPAYYAKKYRIDKYPYRDSTQYKMILNGIVLVRE